MERNKLYWRGGLHQNMLTCDKAADITIVTRAHIHINIMLEDSGLLRE